MSGLVFSMSVLRLQREGASGFVIRGRSSVESRSASLSGARKPGREVWRHAMAFFGGMEGTMSRS